MHADVEVQENAGYHLNVLKSLDFFLMPAAASRKRSHISSLCACIVNDQPESRTGHAIQRDELRKCVDSKVCWIVAVAIV